MDIEHFLDRIVAPGNFIAINWKDPPKGAPMFGRLYKRDDVGGASGMLRYVSTKAGKDAYYSVASYVDAHVERKDGQGRDVYKGERRTENAQNLKCFWIDADVARPGEKFKPDVYPDRRSAVSWLVDFLGVVGLPPPNLRVDSGYGFHWYWLLEDPLTRDEWQPYANMLAAALQQHGFRSISGLSSNPVCLLRPAGTLNRKLSTTIPVRVMDGTRGDYPNGMVLSKLEPYRGAVAPVAPTQGALGGNGPAAAFATLAQPNMAAAAQANLPHPRDRSFALIANKCAQVKQSLSVGGDGDPYQLWYLGHLSLAHHCEDGAAFVHEISKGDPRYTPTNVDNYVAQLAAEKAAKDRGPPRCTTFASYGAIVHPGACDACPFKGKINSPWVLGLPADDADLPEHYRRKDGTLEHFVQLPTGSNMWIPFLSGDVFAPILDKTPQGHRLTFTYEWAGRHHPVQALEATIPTDAAGARSYFAPQHVSLERLKAPVFGDFLVAWIKELRAQHAERTEIIKPFGYATTINGEHIGVAVGGTLYRSDGSTEPAPGADAGLVAGFAPRGTYQPWRDAFDLVCADRPYLQLIVATAFGAPHMHFTGQKGLIFSAWSQQSGVGKSAAMRIGQTVWSAPKHLISLDDTNNAVNDQIASTQIMPCYWDEMRIGKQSIETLVNTLFVVAQGKEKARMRSDITRRDVREWETLVMVASNAPLMDHVVAQVQGSDAGAVRLFEYNIAAPPFQGTGHAARTVLAVNNNYGHAGRVYIEYLATHFDAVKKTVGDFSDALEKDFGAVGEERMYIAGAACILTGALLANKLSIAAFDLKGLYALLKTTFNMSRLDRASDLVTSGGVVDVEQVLGRFCSDYMGSRMNTNIFARQGASTTRPGMFKVYDVPMQQGHLEVQVAIDDKIMRINRATFTAWCRRQGLNALDVMRQLETRLGAVKDKGVLGGGTIYTGGRISILDVPLTDPSMASYLVVPAAQVSALASPPTTTLGNQPKV